MEIKLPKDVEFILNKLNEYGYEAYVVGGCVRDSVLGLEPHDWDICTNALPEEVNEVFKNEHVIPTGMQHGTVTVMKNHEGYEVTTFRTDGDYSDGRHPDDVKFVKSITEDLSRRDFTINAMAYNHKTKLVDPFNGLIDLYNKKLRCVGNAHDRFTEDALRMMRAMRFAATYGLEVESETEKAIFDLGLNLSKVSKERITDEFCKLFAKAERPGTYLLDFKKLLFVAIPELEVTDGFKQITPWHQYDVFTHTMKALDNATGLEGKDKINLRFALLLHDIGKPASCTIDRNGNTHFYNHAEKSVELIEKVFQNDLRLPNKDVSDIRALIANHSEPMVDSMKDVKQWIAKIGKDRTLLLIAHKQADILGYGEKTPKHNDAMKVYQQLEGIGEKCKSIDLTKECTKLSDLKINGNDLIQMGIKPGPEFGRILNDLFHRVLDEQIENDKDVLTNEVINYIKAKDEATFQNNLQVEQQSEEEIEAE